MLWDEEFDVIIVGSGVAGLAAALAAREHGLSAVVLEKAALLGGGSCYSSGLIWIGNNSIARKNGHEDSRDETVAYLKFLAAGFAVEENLLAYAVRGPEALDFFVEAGVPFQVVRVPDHYYNDRVPGSKSVGRTLEAPLISMKSLGDWGDKLLPSPYLALATVDEAIHWGGRGDQRNWDPALIEERRQNEMRACGPGLVAHFLKSLINKGGMVKLATPVQRLVTADGAVTGVVAGNPGRGIRIRALKGVVLATGGYEANPKLVKDYENLPEWASMFPESVTGDGLIMGSEIGATVRLVPNLTVVLGFQKPDENDKTSHFRVAGTVELGRPHTIVVNSEGQRFGDESHFQRLVNEARRFDVLGHRYPNLPCYLLFDQSYAEKYPFAGVQVKTMTGGAAGPTGRPSSAIPDWVRRAETLSALATQLGIDAGRLETTVGRFNTFARHGVDEDFQRGASAWANAHTGDLTHKPNANLGPLERPPYYGVRLTPAGVSSAGLLTNEWGQVLHVRGHAIPGLYATGNAAASVDYGMGFQAGYTLGRGMTFSYLAVKHMNERA